MEDGVPQNDREILALLIAAACFPAVGTTEDRAIEPVDIGWRRALLIDRHIVNKLHGTQMLLNHSSDRGVAVPLDQHWEGACVLRR